MNKQLENDLYSCRKMITADWRMQNNWLDRQTNFVYKCRSLDECCKEINERRVDKEYALHRWYNYMTSVACENIFCDYGALHENDIYNHDVDIYINGVPFDVKLTVYPAKLSERPFDLETREGKDEMIRWFYKNQSQQSRKQLLNRLYVVCDGASQEECLSIKSNFPLLRKQIKKFMEKSLTHGVNEINIIDNGKTYSLKSDIIFIKNKEKQS